MFLVLINIFLHYTSISDPGIETDFVFINSVDFTYLLSMFFLLTLLILLTCSVY